MNIGGASQIPLKIRIFYFENLSRIQFEADVVEKFKRNNVEMKMN